MDKATNGDYPVYLLNEEYGIRGLDYRAESNPLGICLVICSPFSDLRTRIQGLMRVGRNGDACVRIQNTEAEEIDDNKLVDHKGRMRNAEE
jgi:hypothetical protein